ncbi:MAG: hypothetical protein MJE63_07810 [Proteobacteria bacterium]|nr:hypothetical protein [Pseudomonadota bacterium]
MKALKIAIIMILGLNVAYSLYGWLSGGKEQVSELVELTPLESQAATITQEALDSTAADGLELVGLTALVKEVRSGQELERRLNEQNSINNLDLNGDGEVDYLFVSEYGEPESKIGYSITAEPEKGEVQEVADVTVEANGDKAEIQVIGNEQIYGSNAIYNDWTNAEREVSNLQDSGGQQMHRSYFYPHPLWISPWFFGFYPSFFSPFPVMSRTAYVNRMNNYNTSSIKQGRNNFQTRSAKALTNPNKGKVANKGIARSLKNPTSTQKQFKSNLNKTIKSGGFGRTSRPASGIATSKRAAGSSFGTSSRTNTSRFGSPSRTGSSRTLFGRSGKSYGSSSSSFRSSSFGSRSFSFGK